VLIVGAETIGVILAKIIQTLARELFDFSNMSGFCLMLRMQNEYQLH